jgi:hypothetical protein
MLRLTLTTAMLRIRVEECTNSNDNVYQDAKDTFKIVRLSISQERPDNQNSEDEGHRVENLKVHVHVDAQSPADDDDKGSVEQSGLDTGAEDVGEGEVHLVVPGFVNGC